MCSAIECVLVQLPGLLSCLAPFLFQLESRYIRMAMLPTSRIIPALRTALLTHAETDRTDQRQSAHQPDYFSRTAYYRTSLGKIRYIRLYSRERQ